MRNYLKKYYYFFKIKSELGTTDVIQLTQYLNEQTEETIDSFVSKINEEEMVGQVELMENKDMLWFFLSTLEEKDFHLLVEDIVFERIEHLRMILSPVSWMSIEESALNFLLECPEILQKTKIQKALKSLHQRALLDEFGKEESQTILDRIHGIAVETGYGLEAGYLKSLLLRPDINSNITLTLELAMVLAQQENSVPFNVWEQDFQVFDRAELAPAFLLALGEKESLENVFDYLLRFDFGNTGYLDESEIIRNFTDVFTDTLDYHFSRRNGRQNYRLFNEFISDNIDKFIESDNLIFVLAFQRVFEDPLFQKYHNSSLSKSLQLIQEKLDTVMVNKSLHKVGKLFRNAFLNRNIYDETNDGQFLEREVDFRESISHFKYVLLNIMNSGFQDLNKANLVLLEYNVKIEKKRLESLIDPRYRYELYFDNPNLGIIIGDEKIQNSKIQVVLSY